VGCSAIVYKMIRDYADSKKLSMREAVNEIVINYFNVVIKTMDADELSTIREERTNLENTSKRSNPQSDPIPKSDPTPPTTMPTQSAKFASLSMEELKERYTNRLTEEQIESCRCRTCNRYYDPNDIMDHEAEHKSKN